MLVCLGLVATRAGSSSSSSSGHGHQFVFVSHAFACIDDRSWLGVACPFSAVVFLDGFAVGLTLMSQTRSL